MISWETYNIDLGRGAGRTSGYVKTYCPKCHENGKPKSDHSLSCNVETGPSNATAAATRASPP